MHEKISQYVGRATVTDGAWGTQLQAQGLPPGACPDAWNVEDPPAVEGVARGYVQAGSQVILTNTFRANRFALEHWGLAEKAGELAEAGTAISRRAGGDQVAVFASIGPTGKIVMMGDVPPEEIHAAFAEQAAALARGGADAILCETFAELDELKLAIQAAREKTDLPVLASMTFDSGPDKTRTMMGTSPADLAGMALEAGASAVGANCGAGPENYVRIARMLSEASDLPVWIKPNAGLPVARDGQTVFPMGPDQFAEFVPALIAAGANFIGGCCGTTPEHVRRIRKSVNAQANR
jgi:5-methyltetrahydrofolate--homocysteine methyltransferase